MNDFCRGRSTELLVVVLIRDEAYVPLEPYADPDPLTIAILLVVFVKRQVFLLWRHPPGFSPVQPQPSSSLRTRRPTVAAQLVKGHGSWEGIFQVIG